MQSNLRILVFALLKPSQIDYKIIPLSNSPQVNKIYILRKNPIFVNNTKVECITLPRILRLRPFYWIFTSIYGVWQIKKKKVDLIICYNIFPHGFNAFVASLITRKPLIFAEINEDTINYYKKFYTRFIIRSILNHAKIILVPGSRTKEYWENAGFHKTCILHSTINTDIYSPANEICKKYDFIYIGEFDKNKRPDVILDCFSEIIKDGYNATLCLLGFGMLKKKLIENIARNRIQDSVNIIKTNAVLPYLRQSKIFVMSSLSEGIPCSLLEAMACELVVLIPPVGDIADVVKNRENGFLHNNAIEDIYKQMLIAYNNFTTLEDMRINARRTIINEHSYQVATQRWTNILINL